MTFPTIPTGGRILTAVQANTTATRTFPNFSGLTFGAGDLLVAICVGYQTSTGTNAAFSGWGQSFSERHDSASSTTMAIGIATKIATGSETGALTVTQAGTITGSAGLILFSIPAGTFDPASPPEFSVRVSGVNSALDPGSLTPSWGADDTLWVEIGGSGETGTGGSFTGMNGASTNYTGYTATGVSNDAVGGVAAAVAFRQNNAASEDPDAMSNDISNARWGAVTMAIKPAAPASDPPVADAGTDQTVGVGDPVTLDGTGSTDDVGIVTWLWEQLGLTVQPTFGAATQSSTTDTFSSSKTVPKPAGTVENTVVVIMLTCGTLSGATVAWPSGFTEIPGGPFVVTTDSSGQAFQLAWKRCGPGGDGAGTYSLSYSATVWNIVQAFSVNGCRTTGDPFEDFEWSITNASGSVPALNITTTEKDLLVFMGIGDSNNGPMDWTPPSSPVAFTEVIDNDYNHISWGVDTGVGSRSVSGASMSVSQDHGQAVLAFKGTTGDDAVTLTNEDTDTATFTAPASPAVLDFQLTVTDGDGQSDTDTITVTVEAGGGGPTPFAGWGVPM